MKKNKDPFATKIKTLKVEEERKVIRIAKEGKKEKEKLLEELENNKNLNEREKKSIQQKIKKIEKECARAIRLIVYYNQHLVKYIARGYFSSASGIDYEDLVSEGIFSLIKAIELFDLNSSNRFATPTQTIAHLSKVRVNWRRGISTNSSRTISFLHQPSTNPISGPRDARVGRNFACN